MLVKTIHSSSSAYVIHSLYTGLNSTNICRAKYKMKTLHQGIHKSYKLLRTNNYHAAHHIHV